MTWSRVLNLYILLDRLTGSPLVRSATSTEELTLPEFFQSDTFTLRLWFLNQPTSNLGSPTSARLTAGTEIIFAAKKTTALSATDLLFSANGFSEIENPDVEGTYYYEAELSLATAELTTAFTALDAATRSLDVAIDIELQNPANTERFTRQFDARVRRQVYDGEVDPTPSAPLYPAPAALALKADVPRYVAIPGSFLAAGMPGDVAIDTANSRRWEYLGDGTSHAWGYSTLITA